MSRISLGSYSTCSLGALLLAAGFLIDVSTVQCQTGDSGLDTMKQPRKISIGTIQVTHGQKDQGVVYLPMSVPSGGKGVMYKIEAYFVTTEPVHFQIWRREDGSKSLYKLKHQILVRATTPNTTQVFYTMKDPSATVLQCPEVHPGYKIGLFSLGNILPISHFYDPNRQNMRAAPRESAMDIGDKVDFSNILFPYQFSLKVYLYKDSSVDSTDGSFGRCPENLITMDTSAPDVTTTPTTLPTTGPPSQTTTRATTFPVTPGTTVGTGSSGTGSSLGQDKPAVWPVVTGVVAGVAVVAIIVGITIYCRRKRKSPADQEKASKAPPNGTSTKPSKESKHAIPRNDGYLLPVPSVPSTVNAAYGINFDFMNTYVSPDRGAADPIIPSTYTPIIPPRTIGESAHGQTNSAYEEIQDTEKPRMILKPPIKTGPAGVNGTGEPAPRTYLPLLPPKPGAPSHGTNVISYEPIQTGNQKPTAPVAINAPDRQNKPQKTNNNKGWKLPGMTPQPQVTRMDSESAEYDYVDPEGIPNYLELLPDDASTRSVPLTTIIIPQNELLMAKTLDKEGFRLV